MRKSKRMRSHQGRESRAPNAITDPLESIAEKDHKEWMGWSEIESEPAVFNTMLKRMGVENVKVREIVSLDEDFTKELPRPVYGLIFLFKWREETTETVYNTVNNDIWFANQTVSNACATVALLNILYNVPEVKLGVHLAQFKSFTKDFSPALKGEAVGNFGFVRNVHNSFARKMDILNSNLQMKNELTMSTWKPRKHKTCELDPSFHFSAFLPISGQLFKLDGLEAAPVSLGYLDNGDWLELVKTDLKSRMAGYGGIMEFAILCLVKDPIEQLRNQLVRNIHDLQRLQMHLNMLDNDWQAFVPVETGDEIKNGGFPSTTLTEFDTDFGVSSTRIEQLRSSEGTCSQLPGLDLTSLLAYRMELIRIQERLRQSIKAEDLSDRLDEEKAADRQHDIGPAIELWLRIHCRKSMIKNLMDTNLPIN